MKSQNLNSLDSNSNKYPQLTIAGTMLWCNGYSVAAKNLIIGLKEIGVSVNFLPILEFTTTFVDSSVLDSISKNKKINENKLLFFAPWVYPKLADETKRAIGYTMFESTSIPQGWKGLINCYTERIIVPCEWNKTVFKSCGVKVPIDVIPLSVDLSQWKVVEKKPKKDFVFLLSGLLDKRKGPDLTVEAFLKTFPKNENVKLVLKTRDNILDCTLPQDSRIKVINERLSPDEMLQLFSFVDCFVFPTRGEGFGLPPLEALATGTPVILTNDGATKEICNEEYIYPLDTLGWTDNDINSWGGFGNAWGNLGKWIEPSVENLAYWMDYVYNHQDEAREKALKGAKWVEECYNPVIQASKLKTLLDKENFFE